MITSKEIPENTRAIVLSASAGSGKTYRLAYNYVLNVIENPASYRNIIAVTFTNKATEEMKSRIIGQLHRLADNRESEYLNDLCKELGLSETEVRDRARRAQSLILHNYSRFTVLTIDTFFQRVLRAFIRELGLELDFALELDADTLLGKAADALIKRIDNDPALQKWVSDYCRERMDNDRSWDIRRELLRLGKELFKEQNKESLGGKESKEVLKQIIDACIARSEAAKESVRELARRAIETISAAGVSHSDFRNNCSRFFISFEENPTFKPGITAAKCAASTDAWFRKGKRSPAAEAIAGTLQSYLAQILDICDKSALLWNTAAALQKNFRSFALLTDLNDAVDDISREERTMLLSETKYLLSKFIADNDAPFIYEKIGSRFDRFMIDEFQDTSLKEWYNFLPLLRNAIAQSDRPSVLLVGDVKQAIYRWRGGDRKIINQLSVEELGKQWTFTDSLSDNYRSLEVIVNFNYELISKVVELDNDRLNTALNSAAADGRISPDAAADMQNTLQKAYLTLKQDPKKKADQQGFVDITVYENKAPVIERIKAILDKGFKPKDIMILVRDKATGANIAGELLKFKHSNTESRYSFDVMTQEALIIGSAPVAKFITAVLALAINPANEIERAMFRRYGEFESIDMPLTDEEKAFLRSIRTLSPEEAFERTVIRYSLDKHPEHTAYLQALHERIVRFSSGRVADLRMWLDRWNESEASKSLSVEQSETTIEITTIHKAKGLEKKVVIIPSCDWGLNPKSLAGSYLWAQPKGDSQLQKIGNFPVSINRTLADSHFAEGYYRELVESHVDNINLLYVALTRPIESLHIFISKPPASNDSLDTAGRVILAAAKANNYEFRMGDDGCSHFTRGEFAPPAKALKENKNGEKEPAVEHKTIRNYTTRKASWELSLQSQRYAEEGLSPADFGILMHKTFAEAESCADLTAAVDKMTRDALISQEEAQKLRQEIGRALENPLVRSWFECDGGKSVVRNENDIIRTNGEHTKRPDRVIINGRQATVVDYKFGHKKSGEYVKQVREYISLLSQMGYTDVKGYLWYVTTGEVEEIRN